MTPHEIDDKHRLRAQEIIDTAKHFDCNREELIELIAEGMQAVHNIKHGIVLTREPGRPKNEKEERQAPENEPVSPVC